MSVTPPNAPRVKTQPEEKERERIDVGVGPMTEIAVIAKEGIALVVSSVRDTLKATPPAIQNAYSTLKTTVEKLKEAIEEHLEEPPKEVLPPEDEKEYIEVDPKDFIILGKKKKEE